MYLLKLLNASPQHSSAAHRIIFATSSRQMSCTGCQGLAVQTKSARSLSLQSSAHSPSAKIPTALSIRLTLHLRDLQPRTQASDPRACLLLGTGRANL